MSHNNEISALLNQPVITPGKLYEQLYQSVRHMDADVPLLIDFGDSYCGSKIYPPLNLFVASTLASLGYPCLVHGSSELPEDGSITHHQILQHAGKRTDLSLEEAVERLSDPDIAWAYIDQKAYSPELAQWRAENMDSPHIRTLLALENKLQPIRGIQNYLFSQYFENESFDSTSLLKDRYDSVRMFYVQGIEGTSMLDPTKATHCRIIEKNVVKDVRINGRDLGFNHPPRSIEKLTIDEALHLGLLVLDAEETPLRKFIQFQCVAILHYLFDEPVEEALYDVRQAIDSGSAMIHWNAWW